jgi:xanthine dehydrogenase YagS FAD-binding subunit
MHAVLGASDQCIAVHPSDMAVALTVLDAQIETIRADGQARRFPISELYRLPGDTPQIETILEAGELITGVVLPPPPQGKQIYRKVRDRASYAFALVSVAAIVNQDGSKIQEARFAFGGLAHRPWRAPEAERQLSGKPCSDTTFAEAGERALQGARGHGGNDFKIPLAKRTLARTLKDVSWSQT